MFRSPLQPMWDISQAHSYYKVSFSHQKLIHLALTAMKKVLSPSSEKKISKNACMKKE